MQVVAYTAYDTIWSLIGSELSDAWVVLSLFIRCPPVLTGGKLSIPAWSFSKREGGLRGGKHVQSLSALALDYDDGTPFDQAVEQWRGWAVGVHTTFSHTYDHPKLRVILPLSRPITPEEYGCIWQFAHDWALHCGSQIDIACNDPSRLFFQPRAAPTYQAYASDGDWLDVDYILGQRMPQMEEIDAKASSSPVDALSSAQVGNILSRAKAFLRTVPGAVQGEGGDAQTYSVVNALIRGFGLWEDQALELLLDVYNPRCEPPWSKRDLKYKVMRAVRNDCRPWGYKLERGYK